MLIVAVVVSYVDGREVWRNGSTHETDVVRLYAETAVQCRSRGAEAGSGMVLRCAHQQFLRCLIGIVVRKDRDGQDMREGGREVVVVLYNGRVSKGKLQVASSLIFRRVARDGGSCHKISQETASQFGRARTSYFGSILGFRPVLLVG